MQQVQLISRALFRPLAERAESLPRRRTNHNFHPSLDDNPHRFLNVMLRGAYIQPHRHLRPPKAETFLALEGRIAVFVFGDGGEVRASHVLDGGEVIGIDIAPGVWHGIAVLSDWAVCFEVKPGPYQQATDKDFAPWAPPEGDPAAPAYLERLERIAATAGV